MLSLKTMTESKLKVLKRQVEAALQARVAARRQEIESELSRLSQLDGGGRAKVVGLRQREWLLLNIGNPRPLAKVLAGRNVENITSAVLLTSAKIEHTEPLCLEPPDGPLPVEALSATSVYPNNIPGGLGGDTTAIGAA